MKRLALVIAAALVMPSAHAQVLRIGSQSAVARIIDTKGLPVGTATITRSKKHGLRVVVSVRTIAPGEHGVHVHSVGNCEGPRFTSAGPHWNPEGKLHGLSNPDGAHIGDLPNMLVNRKGRGVLKFDIPNGAFEQAGGLLDDDGSAIVIHASSDDQRTDPTGNSGDRIACGVFVRK